MIFSGFQKKLRFWPENKNLIFALSFRPTLFIHIYPKVLFSKGLISSDLNYFIEWHVQLTMVPLKPLYNYK